MAGQFFAFDSSLKFEDCKLTGNRAGGRWRGDLRLAVRYRTVALPDRWQYSARPWWRVLLQRDQRDDQRFDRLGQRRLTSGRRDPHQSRGNPRSTQLHRHGQLRWDRWWWNLFRNSCNHRQRYPPDQFRRLAELDRSRDRQQFRLNQPR